MKSPARSCLILTILILLTNIMPAQCDEQMAHKANIEYDQILSMFSGTSKMWIGCSLFDKIRSNRKKDVIYYIIFQGPWQLEKSIFQVKANEGKILNVCKLLRGTSAQEIPITCFQSYCCQSALMLYCGVIYVVAPNTEIAVSNQSLGVLLIGPLFDVCEKMGIMLPTNNLTAHLTFDDGDEIYIDGLSLIDKIESEKVFEKICRRESRIIYRKWKVKHEKLLKKLPRKPPVVYGNGRQIIKKYDGTFVIPTTPPPTTKTIRWKETVWANASAQAGNVWANVNVPVGTVDHERTKKLTSMYNYESLKEKLEAYQKLLKQIESDKPPQLDIPKVRNKLSKIIKVTISNQ